MESWNHLTFVELFRLDPRRAFEYRHRCLGDPIPAEYAEKPAETVENADENAEEQAEYAEKPAENASEETAGGTTTEKTAKRGKKATKSVE